MKDLLNSDEPLTLERLREFFHENDFSTMPVKDPSEYNEDELELYNVVLILISNHHIDKIHLLPVILLMVSLDREQMVLQSLSITF